MDQKNKEKALKENKTYLELKDFKRSVVEIN